MASRGGAAQPPPPPPWKKGGAAQPTSPAAGGAAKLDNVSELTVGFYNLGIQLSEVEGKRWTRKERLIKADIEKAMRRLLEGAFYHEAQLMSRIELVFVVLTYFENFFGRSSGQWTLCIVVFGVLWARSDMMW